MVHYPGTCSQNDIAKLTSRQEPNHPFLKIPKTDIEAWGDDTSLVEAAVQLYNYLPTSMVVDLLELSNVPMLLHHTEVFDDDLGTRSDQHLTLACFLRIGDRLQGIIEDGSFDHGCGLRFSNRGTRK